jgi:hypothetical protein
VEPLPPINVGLLIASLSGSMVYCFVRPDRENAWRSLGAIASGAAVGFWLAGPTCDYLHWDSQRTLYAVGFGEGLLGITLAKSVLFVAEKSVTQVFSGVAQKWLGKPPELPGPPGPPGPVGPTGPHEPPR